MLFDDTYRTIEAPAEGVFRDRGSKFWAYAYPISSDADIKNILNRLKAEHPKANHYCWAMRLTPDRSIFRINDDGEPAGTAGRPILNTLLSRDLTNVLVVVVRYFGGTLLGVPGLISAYKTATEDALNKATVISKTINDIYTLRFDDLQMNAVMKIIKEHDLAIIAQNGDTSCSITIMIRKTAVNKLLDKFGSIAGLQFAYERTA